MTVLLRAVSLFLLSGRGSTLVAGFNTLPQSEKAKYDRAVLSKFIGKIVLPMALVLPFRMIEDILA